MGSTKPDEEHSFLVVINVWGMYLICSFANEGDGDRRVLLFYCPGGCNASMLTAAFYLLLIAIGFDDTHCEECDLLCSRKERYFE